MIVTSSMASKTVESDVRSHAVMDLIASGKPLAGNTNFAHFAKTCRQGFQRLSCKQAS